MVCTSRFMLLCGICVCALAPLAALADAGNSATSGDYSIVILPDQEAPAHETQIHVEDGVLRFYTGEDPRFDVSEETADTAGTRTNTSFTDVGYSGHLFLRDSDDKISGVTKWEKEVQLSLDYKDWSAYFRFADYNVYAGKNDPFRWEKANLRYRHDDLKLTFGSFGAVFNRGLALNMFEDQNLDFDNEVEGAKVEYSHGDTDLTALWGSRKDRAQWHDSTVGAVRAHFTVNSKFDVGAHAVEVSVPDVLNIAPEPQVFDYHVLGGDINLHSGPVTLNAEAITIERSEFPDASQAWDKAGSSGRGYYINAGYSQDRLSLSMEYKDYRHLVQPFSVLPPLRRWNESATANPDDDKGYGAALTYSLPQAGSYVQMHYMTDNMHEGELPHNEWSAAYNSPTNQKTTWVGEQFYVNDFGTKHNVQRLTVNHQLDNDWTASTYLEREHFATNYSEPWIDYIVEAELAFQSEWNIGFTAEMTGKTVPEGQDDRWGLWEFKYRPDENQEFNLGLGSRREGFACSGGVCRREPAFDGFKVDYLRRF